MNKHCGHECVDLEELSKRSDLDMSASGPTWSAAMCNNGHVFELCGDRDLNIRSSGSVSIPV